MHRVLSALIAPLLPPSGSSRHTDLTPGAHAGRVPSQEWEIPEPALEARQARKRRGRYDGGLYQIKSRRSGMAN
jgi:hypothetical protein